MGGSNAEFGLAHASNNAGGIAQIEMVAYLAARVAIAVLYYDVNATTTLASLHREAMRLTFRQ